MRYLKILFLIVVTQSFAQSVKVEYEFYRNLGIPVTDSWILIYNQDQSYFYKIKNERTKNNDIDKFESTKDAEVIEMEIKVDAHSFYYTNFTTDSLYFQGNVIKDLYYVREKIQKPKWILKNEYKNINDYYCQKAITTFRGRSYTAWFTTELPTTAGPWKFNGLPGLILSLNDSFGKVSMQAKEITRNPETSLSDEVAFLKPQGVIIGLKDFIKLKDNEASEIIKELESKLGRSSSISSFHKAKSRSSLEISYEWEEEKD